MVPVRASDQLIPGTFEHALNYIVDHRIDLEEVGSSWFCNDAVGARAYNPACLLKIVLLGYSRGLCSSRRIARACRENVLFMAISGDSRPHFTTIACFVRNLQEEILGIFCTVLLICSELELVGGELFAVDGCKISSNASKEWSGTFEELAGKREKIRKRVKLMMDSHAREDRREGRRAHGVEGERLRARVARQKRAMERISAFLATHEPKPGTDRRERQSNVTDNDSGKLKGSHGTVQGYNALAIVDAKHQVIVAADVAASVHEGEQLEQMLQQAEANAKVAGMGKAILKGTKLVADTSYYSERNVKLCDERGIDAYLPDPQFRSRDPRFPRRNRRRPQKRLYGVEQFRYDKRRNVYRCPNGKQLRPNARCHRVKRFEGRRYLADAQDCQNCRRSTRCLKAGAKRRQLYIVDRTLERDWLGEMRRKIDSLQGRAQYAGRMGIVEPVFGNTREAKRMDRFTLRGNGKVRVQWLMYTMVHNIEKIAHYGELDGPPRKTRRRKPGGQ